MGLWSVSTNGKSRALIEKKNSWKVIEQERRQSPEKPALGLGRRWKAEDDPQYVNGVKGLS
ncbi:rCG60908 [Rattus norvegicus]|uniref:RCG60908 n=1 Tax=Rattus norvegicus TaxID=10116 RepID=A6JKV5_RAT|nr:rCG60908 [Rattus norvegicus]